MSIRLCAFFASAFLILPYSALAQLNSDYFQIESVTVNEVAPAFKAINAEELKLRADHQKMIINGCQIAKPLTANKLIPKGIGIALGEIDVILDQVINIGKKVWAVVQDGKPVVQTQFDSANALPQGVGCWTDLQSWGNPQSKVYEVRYNNILGMTVVYFSFRVTYVPGGQYKNQGRYITNASIQPAALNVLWGYSFAAQVEVPEVFNQGTIEDPIAGMQLNLKWAVDTALAHQERTESFFINGKGDFQKLQ